MEGRVPMLSAFGKRCKRTKQTLCPLSGTQKVVLCRKRLHQASLFTFCASEKNVFVCYYFSFRVRNTKWIRWP